MTVAWLPFLIFFVLLMAGAFGGRACRTRGPLRPAAPLALFIAAGIMLLLAGLLLGGALLVDRPLPYVPAQPPAQVPESHWPLPPPPASQIPVELDSGQLAERPEAFDPYVDPPKTVPSAPQANPQQVESAVSPSKPRPPRPAWMDAETGKIGNLYRTRITVGPYLSRAECENDLPETLQKAVRTYAARLLGEEKAAHVSLSASYIDDHIVRSEWEERRQTTIDELVYLHQLLEFDGDAKGRIEASYRQAVVYDRLAYIAGGGGALLGLLTVLFAYLKLDTLTRGYYTGRLRLTATAAILALAAIAGLLVLA